MALADPKKAKVTHILADGTVLDSIDGHIPYFEEGFPETLIRVFLSISEKKARRMREEARRKAGE